MKKSTLAASSAFAVMLYSTTALAASDADVASLKAELEQTKALVKKLETRLNEVEAKNAAALQPSAGGTQAVVQSQSAPVSIESGGSNAGNAFNPAISAVLMGGFNTYTHGNPDNAKISGFAMGDEAGLPNRGFSLGESELTLSSNIDDMFYGAVTASISEEGGESSIDLEEAYLETLALPYGGKVKVGRFFPVLGYMNEIHPHADSFIDRPLPYRAFLGGGNFGDDGVQVSFVLPTDWFSEIGGGAYHGTAFPASDHGHGASAQSAFARVGGDVGASHSWLAGVSYLHTDSADRVNDDLTFNGDTNVTIADAKYTWAPNGNPVNESLTLQGEYFWRKEDGDYNAVDYDRNSSGWYAQAVYKFDPKWKTGYRFASLNAAGLDPAGALAGTSLDSMGHDPSAHSVLLEFDNSEFSSVRFQYTRDDSDQKPNNAFMLWYTASMGTHGAHKY